MRQIQAGACLLWALTACSGEEFSPGGAASTQAHAGAYNAGGATNTGSGGSKAAAGGSSVAGRSGSGGTGSASGGAPASSGGASPEPPVASGGKENAGGADDAAPEAGGAGAECEKGAIEFRMLPAPGLETDYLCDAGCGTGWLSISNQSGSMGFPISSACGTASCASCEVQACTASACLATPLTTAGTKLVWDGTYLAKSTCGASNLACQQPSCVPAGKYKARACAAVNGGVTIGGGCMPKDEQLCAEVEFEFPATRTVELVLQR